MNLNEIPRIVAPLALAGAILLSARPNEVRQPVELEPGEPPAPSAAETQAGWTEALASGGPGYDRGAATASVTVLEFADFGCRYCAVFANQTYPQLAREFVQTGRVRWKYVPFVLGMFPNGEEAARAAECAADQGRAAFGRMHDRLYARQQEWKSTGDGTALFQDYAVAAGLNPARFAGCYAGAQPAERIGASNRVADQMGVLATPTFFVNGNRIEGALPAAQFREVLLDALRQGGKP